MSNYQGDDAEYMEDVDDEMEDVEDEMDEEFRGDDLGASDSDVEEFDYSVLIYNVVWLCYLIISFLSLFRNHIHNLCVSVVSE